MNHKTTISYASFVETEPKISLLKNILKTLLEDGLIVAFSGGVDSSFLLWAAIETLKLYPFLEKKGRLLALLTISPSIPSWEIDEAKQFAKTIQAELSIVESKELQQEAYAKNDHKRCYYCKSELFNIAKLEAHRKGYRSIAYGYNASDRQDIRLGHLAAEENHIYSPLAAAGLEKTEIRDFLRQIGFNLSDKPASPCLASRIMTGVRVTEEKLNHIQEMEFILREAGLRVYRVRVHEEKIQEEEAIPSQRYFRIEVAPNEMLTLLEVRETLLNTARKLGYRWVNLDLSGYQMGGGTVAS